MVIERFSTRREVKSLMRVPSEVLIVSEVGTITNDAVPDVFALHESVHAIPLPDLDAPDAVFL
jgi:hypothetical protein